MELLGAEVRPVTLRQPDAQGRGQRGAARLGRDRRRHPLLPRLGDGTAPVPVHGARAAADRRRRGPRAVPGAARRAATPTSSSPASAAARTPRAPSPASSTPRRRARRRRGGRRRGDRQRHPRRRSTACGRSSSRTRSARSSRRTRSPPASTTPASGPSTPTWRRSAGPATSMADDDEVLEAFKLLARDRGDHPRARARPRPRLGRRGRPRGEVAPAGRRCSSRSRAAATRTWPRCASACVGHDGADLEQALRAARGRRAASCSCRTSWAG